MEFNVEPFYDDFETSGGAKDQNYMRILFRPGYPVQARELTQIQSIIQNQIKQFGNHIFQNGSPVVGGQISLDLKANYIKFNPQYDGIDIDLENFENKVLQNNTGTAKVRARVIAVDDTQTNPTVMVKYIRGNGGYSDGSTVKTAGATITYADLVSANASGVGSVVSIDEGVFYVDGYFVQVAKQSIVLDAYSTTPTYRIGLEIEDDIVDEVADTNLLDPAQGTFAYQAPGAHRYQFNLVLAKRALNSVDDSKFFELLRVENGFITKQVKYPIYSELEKTLARRTFDESGNYTVKPFRIHLGPNTSSTSNNTMVINIEPGKAYVQGFEFETVGKIQIESARARNTANNTEYDLSLEYGNYLAVTGLASSNNGLPDLTDYPQFDLHVVPTANVNTVGTAGYNSTKIGTARVRDINRKDEDEYFIYFVDTNTTSNSFTALSGPANNKAIFFPAHYSNLTNAYANVTVKITAGPAIDEVRTIQSYDGSSKVAVVDRDFSANINTNATVVLQYGAKDIESIVYSPTGTTLNVSANVSSASKDVTGNVVITDTNINTLIFPMAGYVKNNSISNADYYARKIRRNVTLNAGNGVYEWVTDANESLYYGSNGANLSSTVGNTHVLVIVTDKGGSSAVANGEVIDMTSLNRSLYRTDSTHLLINVNSGSTTTKADIILDVKVDNVETNATRNKTPRGNVSNTTVLATDDPAHGVAVTGLANTRIDLANGHIWFTDTNDIPKTTGSRLSLYVPDVTRIIKVFDSGSTTANVTSTNAIDITERYHWDSGQTDNYYDHGSLYLKPGYAPPTGKLLVKARFYEHSNGTSGAFTVDSYPASEFASDQIPVYNSRTRRYILRECVDFRPTRKIGDTAFDLEGLRLPNPSEAMELSYQYYLPRIDKLALSKDRVFKVIKGTSATFPVEPVDNEDSMTLYTIYLPAYTADLSKVFLKYNEHKRYTMADIGALEKRIERVEYYTSLNNIELNAKNQTLLYEDNITEKEKYGILADDFRNFKVADISSPEFLCSFGPEVMAPFSVVNPVSLNLNTTLTGLVSPNPYKVNDKTMTLAFTETPAVVQNAATKAIDVQPFLFGRFEGFADLTPDSDFWFSEEQAPVSTTGDPIPTTTPTTVEVTTGGGTTTDGGTTTPPVSVPPTEPAPTPPGYYDPGTYWEPVWFGEEVVITHER